MKSSFKPIITAMSAGLALAGCSTIASTIATVNNNPVNISIIDGKLPTVTTSTAKPSTANTLQFDVNNYKPLDVTVDNQTIKVRAYENIVYVANPVDTAYQSMNIYIPESYFEDKSINGYTASTAPIFMPNAVGGYMPAKPMTVGTGSDGKPNSVAQALHRGMIVASAGARGRTLKSEQGEYYGKAPAAIVDLKAAVRYLKANDGVMAGDAGKIIVNGTSAGGAMTALLGATGDSADYEPYLQKLGAAKASDSVFAVSSYCPITNLEHADMAYEWQLADVVDYKKMSVTMLDYNVKRELIPGQLTDKEKQIAQTLKADFPSYINGLKLKGRDGKLLSLDKNGNGSFKNEVLYYLNKSVNTAHKQGVDLSSYPFLSQKKSAELYYIADYSEFLKTYTGRSKTPPAFDALDLSAGENNLFGDSTTDNRHFTAFGVKHSTAADAKVADSHTIKLMNPMAYLDDNTTSTAQHWRIRHGAKDSDTGFAIPVILATKLANQGKNVDFAMPWDKGHGGDYDLDELFAWVDSVAKAKTTAKTTQTTNTAPPAQSSNTY